MVGWLLFRRDGWWDALFSLWACLPTVLYNALLTATTLAQLQLLRLSPAPQSSAYTQLPHLVAANETDALLLISSHTCQAHRICAGCWRSRRLETAGIAKPVVQYLPTCRCGGARRLPSGVCMQ